jgi:hypothetical protein
MLILDEMFSIEGYFVVQLIVPDMLLKSGFEGTNCLSDVNLSQPWHFS